MTQEFRSRVRRGDLLVGAFIKTAAHTTVEVMAAAGLDFAVVDAEHAPFDAHALDRMALAARAGALPLLLRPADLSPAPIAQALDLGFDGMVAPHAGGKAAGEALLDAVRFDRGRRGFSPSTRAAGYGRGDGAAFRAESDRRISVWRQIEDAADLDRLDEIAAEAEFDCLFIGRADLAASLGVDAPSHPRVAEAVRAIAEAGRAAARTVGIFVSATAEIAPLRELGISVFACGSDQSWLMAEGRRLRAAADALAS